MSPQNSEYMNTKEAAVYLGVSRPWLEHGRQRGYGPPFIKVGGAINGLVRYKRSEVDRWMLGKQRRPGEESSR